MGNILHKVLTGSDLHEVKGASTALNNHILTADGKGSASFKSIQEVLGTSSPGSGGDSTIVLGGLKIKTMTITSRVAVEVDLSGEFSSVHDITGSINMNPMQDYLHKGFGYYAEGSVFPLVDCGVTFQKKPNTNGVYIIRPLLYSVVSAKKGGYVSNSTSSSDTAFVAEIFPYNGWTDKQIYLSRKYITVPTNFDGRYPFNRFQLGQSGYYDFGFRFDNSFSYGSSFCFAQDWNVSCLDTFNYISRGLQAIRQKVREMPTPTMNITIFGAP